MKKIANDKNADKKLNDYLNKAIKKAEDYDNMYLTKESKEGENIVDNISASFSKEGEPKLSLCLKRYRFDEERCFPPSKKDESTQCPVSECFEAKLVLGNCSLNSNDMEPYYFDIYTHFVIKKHPDNDKRRIIYYNYEEDPRLCERNPDFFKNRVRHQKLKVDLEILNHDYKMLKTADVKLTPEQKEEYQTLEKEIVEIEESIGTFTMAPGDTSIDYYGDTNKKNKLLKEKKERHFNYKPIVKKEQLAALEKKMKGIEDELNGGGKVMDEKVKSGEFSIVSKKMCLKYFNDGGSITVRLLYEDDKRNLNKGCKSEWIIEKYFDEEGKDTGLYKIRAEMAGMKFNLSRKPRPKQMAFLGFALPLPEPEPKIEDQLWEINEVGDLNKSGDLGDTGQESAIKNYRKSSGEARTGKTEKKPITLEDKKKLAQ